MSDAALAAVLKRDRSIVAACLVVLILLAWAYIVWLADDMEMGGMDMTGFRMIPAGKGLMMARGRSLARHGVFIRFRHVGRHDGRHDAAIRRLSHPALCASWPAGRSATSAVRDKCVPCGRLSFGR